MPFNLNDEIKLALVHAQHAAQLLNAAVAELELESGIRRAEIELAARRANELFSILSRDQQVNEHRTRTPN